MNQEKNTYEGMFLLDPAGNDFESAGEAVRNILDRSEAEILALKPWEERRLAYEILGKRKGLYILTYFKADPTRIVEIEHDCQLNEKILRLLVLHCENLSETEINAETPAAGESRRAQQRLEAEAAKEKLAADAAADKPDETATPPVETVIPVDESSADKDEPEEEIVELKSDEKPIKPDIEPE